MAKTAIVTGSTSGIGWAIATELSGLGFTIGAVGLTRELADGIVGAITKNGGKAIPLVADVSDVNQVEQAIAQFTEQVGQLDAVVAAAGIHSFGTSLNTSVSDWNKMIAVNLSGVFYTARFSIPHLIRSKGSFTAIASLAGTTGSSNSLAYVASKHGVVGLVRALALDHSPAGVRVNAICPGTVQTPMAERGLAGISEEGLKAVRRSIPVGRFAEPEEIAKLAAFLSSSDSRFITGSIFAIDGGLGAGLFAPPPP
jgi:NAD(P)-dependent dehydrogenase (short-subunit alcohol dehydrogenase family)